MPADSANEVILVHGLWYGAWTFRRLERQLQAAGYSTRLFEYGATAGSLVKHAESLHEFVVKSEVESRHFVGHSLGGLVILKMLEEFGSLADGRVLLLGTPLQGSITARKLKKLPGSRKLLGQVQGVLEQGYAVLPDHRETGMVAGSRGLGLGLLTGGVGGPGDGTVGLTEANADGLTDRVVLPVTHSGMLFSSEVARQSVSFLRRGSFAA